MRLLTLCAVTLQAVLLFLLAYGRKAVGLFLLVALLALPHSALAACDVYFITTPDGKTLMCTNCNGIVICS